MAVQPRTPKGTRDFSPDEVARRNHIFDAIRSCFERFGFQPTETPSFERSETLLGKYGEEGDRLIFRILNSGDKIKEADGRALEEGRWFDFANSLSEKALRYDLTVPFARYVVQHRNDITFPFKRYQIQPVWRADRPQRGRYQEFYQCDADVVGSRSLWQEVEFIQLYDTTFDQLGFPEITLHVNHRKILSGIAEVIGAKDKLIDLTVALDKFDKIGEDGVRQEMATKGITEEAIDKIRPLFYMTGSVSQKLEALQALLASSQTGLEGIQELSFILRSAEALGLKITKLNFQITLARGLNYYTGAIFEVEAPKNVTMGSIGGGGRYDDLTGVFGLKDVSGIGISFGLDRIYLVMDALGLFPSNIGQTLDVLFINFGEEEALRSLQAIKELREVGLRAELYADPSKIAKQMKYANKRSVSFTAMIGEQEVQDNTFVLKEMRSGIQDTFSLEEIVPRLRQAVDKR